MKERLELSLFYLVAAIITSILIFCFVCIAHAEIDMDAIKQIESSGNPLAYNKRSQARGLYQITPICLKEYNNFHPHQVESPMDLFIPEVNERIAKWYLMVRIPAMLKYYGMEISTQTVLASYNWGIGNLRKHGLENAPKETRDYIKKYKELTR